MLEKSILVFAFYLSQYKELQESRVEKKEQQSFDDKQQQQQQEQHLEDIPEVDSDGENR
jgi:hypothetical protein